jgi:hypothetical protein
MEGMPKKVAAAVVLAGLVVLGACSNSTSPLVTTPPSSSPAALNAGPMAATAPPGALLPETFGAVGNDQNDDTSAVQAALDAAATTTAKTVWLSAGKTYLCTKSLQVPSGVTLMGAGPTAVVAFTWFTASGNNGYIINSGDSGITLTNFVVQGDGSGLPSGPDSLYPDGLAPGVKLSDVDGFSVTHLEVRDVPGISIAYFGSQNGTFAYNYVHNSGRDGITGFWDTQNLVDITVEHNFIADVGDDAIALNGAPNTPPAPVNTTSRPYDLTVSDNTIEGWPSNPNGQSLGRGILLSSVGPDVTVTGNTITDTFSSGIKVVGSEQAPDIDPQTGAPWLSTGVTVEGNVITDAGQLSVGCAPPACATLGSTIDGVDVNGAENTSVKGNTIRDPRGQPVRQYGRECSPNCVLQ